MSLVRCPRCLGEFKLRPGCVPCNSSGLMAPEDAAAYTLGGFDRFALEDALLGDIADTHPQRDPLTGFMYDPLHGRRK